jgi:DNA-binding response OmpR family regulator
LNIENLKSIKVLLVEDEEELSLSLKDAIGEYFYSFIIASNGQDGLDKFSKYNPDIVITDINMPKMTGLEMSEILRKDNPNLPIVILSAFSQTNYLLNAIDLSITKYLIKPFDPDELLEYLTSLYGAIGEKDVRLSDDFCFNKNTNTLSLNNEFVKLTKREIEFIRVLINISPAILSEDDMKIKLWSNEDISAERIRTFIKRLRSKTSKELIQNIKGQGYQILPT